MIAVCCHIGNIIEGNVLVAARLTSQPIVECLGPLYIFAEQKRKVGFLIGNPTPDVECVDYLQPFR